MKELNKTKKLYNTYYYGAFFIIKKLNSNRIQFLAPRVGLEPTTFRLTAERSTD